MTAAPRGRRVLMLLTDAYGGHGGIALYNRDVIEAMWRILQQPEGDDYVIATGETHSVRSFVERAFAVAGITIAWEGEGVDEIGRCTETGRVLVRIDPRYFRPTEVDLLLGDPTKARTKLGWTHKVGFEQLVKEMMDADLRLVAEAPLRYGTTD